jgi:hypothetical protein
LDEIELFWHQYRRFRSDNLGSFHNSLSQASNSSGINMPLPENEQVVQTGKDIVKTMQDVFGTPAGYRPGKQDHNQVVLITG